MMNAELPDCTPSCHSTQCASNLISVVTRGNTRQIKTYFAQCCNNAAHVSDRAGRTALHVAASCGKWEIVDWLLKERHADHKCKDRESGWTALHRSLFYGQVMSAVYLIHHGASPQKHDYEDLTPMEIVMKDRPIYVEYDPRNPTQAYTWGSNTNFTLGHGTQQSRGQPELLEELAKSSISVKQVVMCKFHTVLLSHQSKVYTCGHGQGGRLGLGTEETSLVPKLVDGLGESSCVLIAAARDHTMFLMENGMMYSCGQNDYHQLGHSSLGYKCLTPKPIHNKVIRNKTLAGMAAGRYHTVVFTTDTLYTFGLNAGQLGHVKGEKYLITPRHVTALQHKNVVICQVAASDAATVVATKAGDIYVLNDYQCRKIASKQLNLTKLVVHGGTLDAELDPNTLHKQGGEELVLVAQQKSGRIHSWKASERVLRTCQWTRKRQIFILDVALNRHGLVLVTEEGEGYMGHFTKKNVSVTRKDSVQSTLPTRPSPASSPPLPAGSEEPFIFAGPVEKEEYETIHLERLPSIFRATGVACDQQGRNFTMLQSDPRTSLTDIPMVSESEMTKHFSNLLSEADTTDVIHDVILKIGNRTIAAHKYILTQRSEYFRKIFTSDPDLNPRENAAVHVDNEGAVTVDVTDKAEYEIFMLMVKYIYTDTCEIFERGYKYRSSHTGHVLREDNTEPQIHISLDSLTITDMNRSKSAYSVYKEHHEKGDGKVKGHGGKKKKKNQEKGEREDAMLPVRLLVDTAKKFGVSSLVKRLDQVKYKDGCLQNFRSAGGKKLRFERKKMRHLYDVVLQSDDGALFSCHKCVLVARLEYFQSMLGAGWIETSSTEPLKMPIPGPILEIILNYIYTDNAQVIQECQEIDLICNTLTTADQLLMTRLKEMCETALADMITLKNVAELLQFASVYQATQLCRTCQQFIGLNLACLLEARALEVLDQDVLKALTKAYRDLLPQMSYRVITPYIGGPDISHIDPEEPTEAQTNISTDDNQNDDIPSSDNQGSSTNMDLVIKKARAKRKGRRRTSSSGKRHSLSVSESIEEAMEAKESAMGSLETKEMAEMGVKPLNVDVEIDGKHGLEDESPVAMETDKVREGHRHREDDRRTEQRADADSSNGTWIIKGKHSIPQPSFPKKTSTSAQQLSISTEPPSIVQPATSPSSIVQSATSPKTWGWQTATVPEQNSPAKDLRNIMQAQANLTPTPHKKSPSAPSMKSPNPLAKKSQKQRKRELALQFATVNEGAVVGPGGDSQSVEEKPSVCPWASAAPPSASVVSLRQLQEEEVKGQVVGNRKIVPKRSQSIAVPGAQVHISYGLRSPPSRRISEDDFLHGRSTSPAVSPTDYQNPWQQIPVVAQSPPTAPSVSFTDILKSEAEQRENLDKSLKKSFSVIQIEERAIEELKQMYKISECTDEYITVERVGVVVATPTWKKEKR